jgi:hypothetical protein
MKQTFSTLFLLFVAHASFNIANEDQLDSAFDEDLKFWDRFLLGDGLSVPTRSPLQPVPTPAASPTRSPLQPVPTPVTSPLECDVDTALECTSSDGTKCDQLPPVDGVCSDGSVISMLQFRLNAGRKCAMSGNSQDAFCLDCANITSSETFLVLCKNAVTGENLLVQPTTVQQGEIFTVTPNVTSGVLPDRIDCIYVDEKKKKIQQNIINTSGNMPLNLKDKFGAFTLLSCDLGAPPGGSAVKTCLDTLSFVVDVSNVGPVELEIAQLDITFADGTTTTLLGDLESPTINPGDSSALEILLFVDLCSDTKICAAVDVKAVPTNGNPNMCQDYDEYCLQTFPIPPNPAPTPIKPPVPTPVKIPIALPIPIPAPVTLPIPLPIPVPTPVTLPVPIPVLTPVPLPLTPPVPIRLPVPSPPVSPPVPTIPTAPVPVPKSKSSMSKIPSSSGVVSPSAPVDCPPTGKGGCSMSSGSKSSQVRK